VSDTGSSPERIDEAYRLAADLGAVAFVGPPGRGALPAYPPRPVRENAEAVQSLGEVRNFLEIRDSQPFGSRLDYLAALQQTNYDLLIVDAFHEGAGLTPAEVQGLHFKRTGARRLVAAIVNVGSAEMSRFYWQRDWP